MPKAIIVKYLPQTGIKGSRLKATAEGVGSVTVSYDCAESRDERYENEDGHELTRAAAKALCAKAGWTGEMVSGQIPSGEEVFVFTPDSARIMTAAQSVIDEFLKGRREISPTLLTKLRDALSDLKDQRLRLGLR